MSTVIFGLDGADPELVERWIDELPNFKELMERGFFGDFKTIEPPITIPAWMCMFSGNKPSDFNSYDFRTVNFEDYSIDLVNSSNFRGKTLLDSSEKVISLRLPGTTPKYPIDGQMVSGFMKGEEMSYEPKELEREISRSLDLKLKDLRGENREDTRKIAKNNFKENFKLYNYLLDNKEFETAFSVFRMIDTHMHNVDEQDQLLEAYKLADQVLGEIIEITDKLDTNLLVLSDHGSTQTTKKLYLNNLLREKGFLEYGAEQASVRRKIEEKLGSALVNFGLKKHVKRLISIYSEVTGEDLQHTQQTVLSSIEKEGTEAFCYISGVSRYGAIWVHDDRFTKGVVSNKSQKIEEIKHVLEKEKFIDEVVVPRSFLENEEMPDMLVKANKGIIIGGEPYNVNFHKSRAVVHDERGLIAGIGPGFQEGKRVKTKYENIAPTIQALAGDVDSEGEVLEDILEDIEYNDEL
ncbi:MAG: alkaline phosphatase family protein, partial [Candidatus Nanohaloarchaea archaeon]